MQGGGTAALTAAHRIWARLEDGMNLVAAGAIFFLMFVGVFQIIGRTAFNTAIYGYIDYMEQASALFAFLGISYAQRVGAHIRMDLLLRGFSMRFLWSMELFAVLVALVVITILVDTTYENFLRAYQLGDSTIDIKLPIWPTKLLVPVVLAVLWVRLVLQAIDYARLVRHPDAPPIAVPVIETIEVQAKNEIEEALGREERRP
jgi:TRAP-type C4-dicarboxylate transport system permease small subunit